MGVIGNLGVVRKFQKWLGEWEEHDLARRKRRRRGGTKCPRSAATSDTESSESDSDDYFSSDSETSSDGENTLQNTALLGMYRACITIFKPLS